MGQAHEQIYGSYAGGKGHSNWGETQLIGVFTRHRTRKRMCRAILQNMLRLI
ncbi:excinuclease ABC subunit C [Roseobacter sp. SK209-2-6]|nr:excinuclease ABC subunit C [Roseobacter sp. SK209-2-6]